jgi:hypothetical protein
MLVVACRVTVVAFTYTTEVWWYYELVVHFLRVVHATCYTTVPALRHGVCSTGHAVWLVARSISTAHAASSYHYLLCTNDPRAVCGHSLHAEYCWSMVVRSYLHYHILVLWWSQASTEAVL